MDPSGKGQDERPGPAFTEALDGALDTLQDMLERRRRGEARLGPRAREEGPGRSEPDTDPDDLPVLDEVVVPGRAAVPPSPPPAPPPARPSPPRPPSDLPRAPAASPESTAGPGLPVHQDLVQRLESEAEVIIEDALEEAIARARKEVRVRLRRHLEIVLPEILDELLARAVAPRDHER